MAVCVACGAVWQVMMTRKQQNLQRRVEIDAKPPEQYVRDRSRIHQTRKDKAGELASGLMPWVRQYPGAAILSLQWECTVWTRARNACLAIVDLSPDAARMRDLARNLSVYLQQKADGYRGTTTPQASSPADRAGTPYSSDVAEDYAELFRMIAARFPNAARMGADSLQLADCLTQRILLLRPTLHLFPKDATAADAETAWHTYFRTTEELPFHMRKRLVDPLYPGQSAIITLDLAGLVATEIKMKPDLRRALSSGGANPQEEKFRLLPAAVFKKAIDPEDGETFGRFVNRSANVLQELGDDDMPRTEKKVVVRDSEGHDVLATRKVDKDTPSGLGRSGEEDADKDYLSVLKHWEQGKNSSSDSDDFSNHSLDIMELREVVERANRTPRQLDMLKRRVVLGETSKEIAVDYGITDDNVNATVSQTRAKLKAVREDIRHPKKTPT